MRQGGGEAGTLADSASGPRTSTRSGPMHHGGLRVVALRPFDLELSLASRLSSFSSVGLAS